MNTNKHVKIVSLIIIVAILIVLAVLTQTKSLPSNLATKPIAMVNYSCNGNKTINASYYNGINKPVNSGEPPIPGGSVSLKFSDGSSMTLIQTISADGGRYANHDESIVFWNKGRGATFTQNGQQTYMECIETVNDPGGLPQVYSNGSRGFSIRLPSDFSVDENYKYQELGPGKDIFGIKFGIPTSTALGTNLSRDSYISVEQIPMTKTNTCSALSFIDIGNGLVSHIITDSTLTYSVASSTGAGAGNRYLEYIYALPATNPCVAVRYFIHYSVFENYPAGSIKEFNLDSLIKQFDSIRRTLTVIQ